VAETNTAFGRLLNILRSQRDYVPSTLTFPQLDMSALSERLRLTEHAEENGRENRPLSNASQPDRVESEITEIVQEEYSRAIDIHRQGLENYDRRIHGTAIETLGVDIIGAAQDAVSEYTRVAHQAHDEINIDRKNLDEVEKEFDEFREINKLKRGCRSPDGHFIHVGIILLVLLTDSIINGYFLSIRDEFGLLGGVLQAIIVAGANVLLGLFAGRLAVSNLIHKSTARRIGGLILLMVLLALISGLNLSFAHYRDLFASGTANPEQRALSEVIGTPLGLHDIKSWWLIGFGLLFAFVSLLDGFMWDDPYPGYGEVARRRKARREEYHDRKHVWLETLGERREQARAEVSEIRRDIGIMQGEILQASMGRRNFTAAFLAHVAHLESAANQLIDTYRDTNRRVRKTPAPSYFEKQWRLDKTEIPVPNDVDRDHLRRQIEGITTALSDALTKIHETHDQVIGDFDRLDDRKAFTTGPAQQIRLVG
jgi:hypothetical protein